MKIRVIIRADGNRNIGSGHLVRCIALAQMLRNDFEVEFVCKELPLGLENEINLLGIKVQIIEDDKALLDYIDQQDIVVLDGYNFSSEYQKSLKLKGCKLVCIDDLHDKEFFADLIINHAPGVSPSDYKAQPYTQFALGPEFTLLRPAFLEQAGKERIINTIENVLICFGGSDILNLTERTLQVVLENSKIKKIIVITGESYNFTESFKHLIEKNDRVVHNHSINEKEMLEVMLESDLAIVPSSGIMLEAIACGCEVISGYYVENQKAIYEGFLKLGAIIGTENFEKGLITESISNINPKAIKKLIDGKSNKRILSLFKDLINENSNISR
jgi:UDP-2,4-diacetamido-2,4,6-trideoxy-beta-L-altropyranose hydrolase